MQTRGIMENLIEWLCSGPAWIEYRTRIDLLGQTETDQDVIHAREKMLGDPQVQQMIANLALWPGQVVSRHNKADLLMHQLVFLTDLGIKSTDPGMPAVVDKILALQSEEGPFQVIMNISPAIGGTGKDELAWVFCDSPLTLYALLKMGAYNQNGVSRAADYLLAGIQDFGWPCKVSPELGKFHGPGGKHTPCPFATLIALQALAEMPGFINSPESRIGIQSLINLWENRRDKRPFLFNMGTDFCKLKAPFIWYDILHVVEVLSRFPEARTSHALQEMKSIISHKMNDQGQYTPESVWLWWKDWDFGQKKAPSRWLTFLVMRQLKRFD
jgi:hypothetical protein